nr:MAG TPA: Flavinator of succinate dehydrogenase [Caudoviricetes sp.]
MFRDSIHGTRRKQAKRCRWQSKRGCFEAAARLAAR